MTRRLPSWILSANTPTTQFPLNNLPYGVVSLPGQTPFCATIIGDKVIDLSLLEREGVLVPSSLPQASHSGLFLSQPSWHVFMEHADWQAFRHALTSLLHEDGRPELRQDRDLRARAIYDAEAVNCHLPFDLREFTDFYASRDHATNVGTLFRSADNALPANWLHMPIGYNGRASSVIVSGESFHRPWGQIKGPHDDVPRFAASSKFDFELELGAVIGRPVRGPLDVAQANEAIFGYVLLNDWSARDIQAWEYQPLGPFQSKATATTISPWIVTAEALSPFRRPPPIRELPLLPHLQDLGDMHFDIELEIFLAPSGQSASLISQSNTQHLYYSAAQQVAHHASAGGPMRCGDLLGSGTISGPAASQRGSMLELSWNGAGPVSLAGGSTRCFLEDGDTVTLVGRAKGPDYTIGFGPCCGTVLPALEDPFAG